MRAGQGLQIDSPCFPSNRHNFGFFIDLWAWSLDLKIAVSIQSRVPQFIFQSRKLHLFLVFITRGVLQISIDPVRCGRGVLETC